VTASRRAATGGRLGGAARHQPAVARPCPGSPAQALAAPGVRSLTRLLAPVATGIGLAVPTSALAHSPIEGLGHFYNGVLHPALVPSHLVALLGLGLLLARQGPSVLRGAIAAALGGVLVGLFGAWLGRAPAMALELPLLVGATLVGVGAAAELRLPRAASWLLAGALGLAVGLDSTPTADDAAVATGATGMGPEEPLATLLSLAGTALGAGLLLSAALLCSDAFARVPWQRVALRVIGSWIAAAAFMVMALEVAGVRAPGPAAEASPPVLVASGRTGWPAASLTTGGLDSLAAADGSAATSHAGGSRT
jgi:urease accessory protein